MFKHILIPTDGSPLSGAAVDKSVALARDAGAKVTFLCVTEPFHVFSTGADQLESSRASYDTHARAVATAYLDNAARKARAQGVASETVQQEDDSPHQAIIDAATARGCDLIAMASHGRKGMAALVLGSVTTKVLTHSAIPVLVYR